MHENPGQHNCANAEGDLRSTGRMAEFCENRGEAGERRRRGEHQERDRAVVVDGRSLADRSDRCVRGGPVTQHQIKHDAQIPGDNKARRRAPSQREQPQRHRGAERRRQKEPRVQLPQPRERLQFARPAASRG